MQKPKASVIRKVPGLVRFLGSMVDAIEALKKKPSREEFQEFNVRLDAIELALAEGVDNPEGVVDPDDAKLELDVDFSKYSVEKIREFAKDAGISDSHTMDNLDLIALLKQLKYEPKEDGSKV